MGGVFRQMVEISQLVAATSKSAAPPAALCCGQAMLRPSAATAAASTKPIPPATSPCSIPLSSSQQVKANRSRCSLAPLPPPAPPSSGQQQLAALIRPIQTQSISPQAAEADQPAVPSWWGGPGLPPLTLKPDPPKQPSVPVLSSTRRTFIFGHSVKSKMTPKKMAQLIQRPLPSP